MSALPARIGRGLGRLLGLREQDHKNALVGFSTLLLAMAAHSVMETARDTLFLSTLSPKLLPWAYLGIATLTLAAAELHRRVLSRLSHRRTLTLTLLGGAVVSSSFAFLGGSLVALFALYIWTGLLATIVVVQFWLLAGDVMDFGQAKRAFALLGAGGLAGATAGSVIASSVLFVHSARALPVVSGALLAIAAAVPSLFSKRRFPRAETEPHARASETAPLVHLRHDPYLRRILLLALLGTITVTVVDFVFKSVVARDVARESLGTFFSRYYALVNGTALVVQLFLAPRMLRRAGIHRAVQIMPLLVLATGLGFAIVGALWAVLMLKAADGTLRHSVNRVSNEILYLPLTTNLRERFRAFAEAIGLRVGQAVASVFVLAAIAVDASIESIAWAAALLAGAWLISTLGLERLYVGRFRGELRRGTLERRAHVPDLDLRSLEALLTALSSDDDAEVVTALDMFAAYDKTNLIPALVLYHPSPAVVLRALQVLSEADRPDVARVVARLLSHPNHQVRAAALRLYVARAPDGETLENLVRDDSAAVRATALVGLIHEGRLDVATGDAELGKIVRGAAPEAREALALALALLPPATAGWLATELAERDEPHLAAVLARSIAAAPNLELVPALIRLLAQREARADARAALARLGEPALDALERTLADLATPPSIRKHVPRTISRFPGTRPVSLLERFLATERDDTVSFKILRGLSHLRRLGRVPAANPQLLHELARRAVVRAVTITCWRFLVETARKHVPGADTPSAELLAAALSDQEERSLARAFRLMHVLRPEEDLEAIYEAVRGGDPDVRARGRELVEHVAPESLRRAVLALVDDRPAAERVRLATRFHMPPGFAKVPGIAARLESALPAQRAELQAQLSAAFAEAIARMLEDDSRVVRAIAGYHLAELGLGGVPLPAAQREPNRGREALRQVAEQALASLTGRETSRMHAR